MPTWDHLLRTGLAEQYEPCAPIVQCLDLLNSTYSTYFLSVWVGLDMELPKYMVRLGLPLAPKEVPSQQTNTHFMLKGYLTYSAAQVFHYQEILQRGSLAVQNA